MEGPVWTSPARLVPLDRGSPRTAESNTPLFAALFHLFGLLAVAVLPETLFSASSVLTLSVSASMVALFCR